MCARAWMCVCVCVCLHAHTGLDRLTSLNVCDNEIHCLPTTLCDLKVRVPIKLALLLLLCVYIYIPMHTYVHARAHTHTHTHIHTHSRCVFEVLTFLYLIGRAYAAATPRTISSTPYRLIWTACMSLRCMCVRV